MTNAKKKRILTGDFNCREINWENMETGYWIWWGDLGVLVDGPNNEQHANPEYHR